MKFMKFKVGQEVRVSKPLVNYKQFQNMVGIIEKTTWVTQTTAMYYVNLGLEQLIPFYDYELAVYINPFELWE